MYLSSLLRRGSRSWWGTTQAITVLAVAGALSPTGGILHAESPGDIFIRVGAVSASAGTVAGNTVYLDGDSSELRFPIIYGNRTSQSYNVSNAYIIFSDDDGVPPGGIAPVRGTGNAYWGFATANGGNYDFVSTNWPNGIWVDTSGYYPKTDFGTIFKLNCWGCDGRGADTVMFAGAAASAEELGLRPHDSGELFSIRVLVQKSDTGKWICIDSSTNFPPSNKWKWAPYNCQSQPCSTGYPSWSGPHCFVIRSANYNHGEIGNCVPELHGYPDAQVIYDFNMSGNDQTQVIWSVLSGVGRIDSVTGVYSVDSLAAGRYPVTVAASDPLGRWTPAECHFDVVIGLSGIANCVPRLLWYECEHSTYDFDVAQADQSGVRWRVASGGGAIDSLTGVYWAKDLYPMPYPFTYPVTISVTSSSNPNFTATCSFDLQLEYCGIANCPTKIVGAVCDSIEYDFDTRGGPPSRYRFAVTAGPGSIDSLTGLYSATDVAVGRYRVIVTARDTVPPGATYPCEFDLWIGECGIVNCPIQIAEVSCKPIEYNFDVKGTDQSGRRWAVISGPGTIDSLTGEYTCIGQLPGQYWVVVQMTDSAGETANFQCTFGLNIAACRIANCLSTYDWSTCQPFRRDFDMLGPDQSGYRWGLVSGVGSIDSLTGVYLAENLNYGEYPVVIRVWDTIGLIDTLSCSFVINIVSGSLTVNCPLGRYLIGVGQTQRQWISVPNRCGDVKFFQLSNDLHGAWLDTLSGMVTYTWDSADADFAPHCMKVGVADDHDTVYCDVCWTLLRSCPYQLAIERKVGVKQGTEVDFAITLSAIDSSEGLGGFDLVVNYDYSAFTLQAVAPGTLIAECGWEYFTYRLPDNPNCQSNCPAGLIRIVGLAETNNGDIHPNCQTPKFVDSMPTSLAVMTFTVSTDRVFECMAVPIRFYWTDCGDNVLASASGEKAFVNCHLYDWWDDTPIDDPNGTVPGYVGTPNSCLGNPPDRSMIRGIEMRNGGGDILCVDSIDYRGDLNLNGVPYEIADVVMYINYFAVGPTAFGDHVVESRQSSDINNDGVFLSLADLIYLIRVVLGDALPIPKPDQGEQTAIITTEGDKISITGAENIGGILMTLKGDAKVASDRTDFVFFTHFDGVNTRVVAVVPFDKPGAPTGFSGELFAVTSPEIVAIEVVDVNGASIHTQYSVPAAFALKQNYPNPFNPSTTISFDSPKGGAFTITVFNTAGQKVTEITGVATAGTNTIELYMGAYSSGVYLYRLETEGYTATRKAVLLK